MSKVVGNGFSSSSAIIAMASSLALQQIDRLVSSSSPADALDSLRFLADSIKNPRSTVSGIDNDNSLTGEIQLSTISALSESTEFMSALCSILSENNVVSSSSRLVLPHGSSAACELLLAVLDVLAPQQYQNQRESSNEQGDGGYEHDKKLTSVQRQQRTKVLKRFLSQPSDGRLIHAILDVLSPSSGIEDTLHATTTQPLYARLCSMQALTTLALTLPTLVHAQILAAPNGTHRIVELLSESDDVNGSSNSAMHKEEIEAVRDGAIALCTTLARTSPACARLFIFSEAYEKVLLKIAVPEFQRYATADSKNSTSKSSKALGIVADCLQLCLELTKRDTMGTEVFLGSRSLLNALCSFLDLRFGVRYRFPATVRETDIAQVPTKYNGTMTSDGDQDDDLEIILQGSRGKQSLHSKGSQSDTHVDDVTNHFVPIPYLSIDEATIVHLSLQLLLALITGGCEDDRDENDPNAKSNGKTNMKKRQTRQRLILLSYDILSRLVLDTALYTLPPPNSPSNLYFSAVPTLEVQLMALQVVSSLVNFSEQEIQDEILFRKQSFYLRNVGVLDRLMYLICTGSGVNAVDDNDAALKVSMHALCAFRCALSPPQASLLVSYALAPPSDFDSAETFSNAPAPVVQKLVNTLCENLNILCSTKAPDRHSMNFINSIGSAGALGVILTNGAGDTTRDMLLRVRTPIPLSKDQSEHSTYFTSSSSLIGCILSYFEAKYSLDSSHTQFSNSCHDEIITVALLRLLVEWVTSSPNVAAAVLISPCSVILGRLVHKNDDIENRYVAAAIQAFAGLFLGMCLENLSDQELGGWSKLTIMNLITEGIRVSKFTELLERLKLDITSNRLEPWSSCQAETLLLSDWYKTAVNTVRRRVLHEITSIGADGDACDDSSGSVHSSAVGGTKELAVLLSQQAVEMELLRERLLEAEKYATIKAGEISNLKRRMESTPSQIDDMLNDLSAKLVDLEQSNMIMKEDFLSKARAYEEQLKQKDDHITALSIQLDDIRSSVTTITEERNAMQEELQGLSSAYISLEHEYNRFITGDKTIASVTDSADRSEERPKETVAKDTSTSQNRLEQENIRLVQDLRAANEWMSLAVKKMDEFSRHNSFLEAELSVAREASLNSAREMSKHDHSDYERLDNELIDSREQLRQSKHESVSLSTKLNDTQQQLVEKSNKIKELESMLSSLQAQCATADALRSEISTKQDYISVLERAIDRYKAEELVQTKENGNERMREEILKLRIAHRTSQDWMANAVTQYKMVSKQLDEATMKNNEIMAELNELKMGKSVTSNLGRDSIGEYVTHNEQLQTCIEALVAEKALLVEELHETRQTIDRMENDQKKAKLQEDIELLRIELAQMQNLVSGKNQEIESLQNHLKDVQQMLEKQRLEIIRFDTDKGILQGNVDVANSELTSRTDKLVAMISENKNLRLLIEELGHDRLSFKREIESLKEKNHELCDKVKESSTYIEEMHDKLHELQESSNSLHMQKVELEAEKQELQNRLNLVSVREKELNENIDELKLEGVTYCDTINKVTQSNEKLTEENRIQCHEIAEQKARCFKLEEILREKSMIVVKLEDCVETSQKKLDEITAHHDGIVNHLKEKVFFLESSLEKEKTASIENKKLYEESLQKMETQCQNMKNYSSELNNKLSEVTNDLETLRQESENVIQQWQERVNDLETALTEFESQMMQQRQEAMNAIAQWESQNLILQDERTQLQNELEMMNTKCLTLEEKENIHLSTLKRLDESETALAGHRYQLEKQEENFLLARSQLESRCETLQQERLQLSKELELLQETNAVLKDQLHNNHLLLEIQESEIANMHRQYDSLELKFSQHCDEANQNTKEHNLLLVEKSEQISKLQSHLNESTDSVRSLKNEIGLLNEELISNGKQSEDVVKQWQDYVEQLETANAELEKANSAQQKEANAAIELWEARCDALSRELEAIGHNQIQQREYAEYIEVLISEKTQVEASLLDTQKSLQSIQEELGFLKRAKVSDEITRNELESTITALKCRQEELVIEVEQLRCSVAHRHFDEDALEKSKLELQELKVIIGQLEDELRDANDALHLHLTDEVSARATEIATQALRCQLADLRLQLNVDREALTMERDARIKAEQEVEKLQYDLTLLVQGYEGDCNVNLKVKKLTSKAAESIVQKNREEVNCVRATLEKIMSELSDSRTKERDAEEKAAQYRSQALLFQKELSVAIFENSELKQVIIESRQAELKKHELLEHRIHTLENDQDSSKLLLNQEIESLRTSLAQLQMERDRLTNALQESEKANTALVYTSIGSQIDKKLEEESELEALRIERSHLLLKTAQDASQVEKRIREAVAANTALLQAEVFMERGLRAAANRLVDDLQKQLYDSKSVGTESNVHFTDSNQELNSLRSELKELSAKLTDEANDNRDTKLRLATVETDAIMRINELEEKCRQAESKLVELQRRGEFEASVAAELANLRKFSKRRSEKNNFDTDESYSYEKLVSNSTFMYDDNRNPDSMRMEELVDYVFELKQSINEERKYYRNLCSEHEELLALLTRQDIEKDSLQRSLSHLAGQEAVDQALAAAENEVAEKFGVVQAT